MDVLALAIASVSLVLGAVAYWRSGGKRDVQSARREIEREIEALQTTLKEFREGAAQVITAGFEASRRGLKSAAERLRQLKEEAIEGLEKQITRAQEQISNVARQLEEAARSAAGAATSAARQAERAIAVRAHRLEARVDLLFAKAMAIRAIGYADKQEFFQAEERLEAASERLRAARQVLGDDHAYDQLLDAVRDALREATVAVRSRAEILRGKLESVLSQTDRLVQRLESDEEGDSNSRRNGPSTNGVVEQDRDGESCCHPEVQRASAS